MDRQQTTRPGIQRQNDHWDEVHNQMIEVQAQQKVQKKSLDVSDAGDADEKEADQIARKVVGGSEMSGANVQQNRKDIVQLQNNAEPVKDYMILLSEPLPKILPSFGDPKDPKKTIEVTDPFMYPSVSMSSQDGTDQVMDVLIQRWAYKNGKSATENVGIIHVKKGNDAVTPEYPDPIKQLAQWEFSEKDLFKLQEIFRQIPGLDQYFYSMSSYGFRDAVGVARKTFLREEKRKANNGMPGSIGLHLDEDHPEDDSDINQKRYVVYENEVRWKGSNSWRNNNPGNITKPSTPYKYGEIGYDAHKPVFGIYPDKATGRAAMRSLLLNVYGNSTIKRTMNGWDPSTGDSYANKVSTETGLPVTTVINDLNETQLTSVMNAIEKMEGWQAGIIFKCGEATNPTWVQNLLQCD